MKVRFIILAGTIALLAACEKDPWMRSVNETTDVSNKAFIKVYNATVASPSTRVYLDGALLSGGTVGYTGLFPQTVSYSAIDPGAHVLNIKDIAATPKLNLNVNGNLEAGKYYTLFLYDSLNTAKTKLVNDDIQIPTDTTARIRFANLLFSSVAIPNIDIYSQNLKANVFTNIPVGDVTPFINHMSMKADTFSMRPTGTTTIVGASLIFTPGQKRSYTLIARGRYQTTTGTTARTLTVMTNR